MCRFRGCSKLGLAHRQGCIPPLQICPLIPQPLLPEGEGEPDFKVPLPQGEGFRVRVTQLGCTHRQKLEKRTLQFELL